MPTNEYKIRENAHISCGENENTPVAYLLIIYAQMCRPSGATRINHLALVRDLPIANGTDSNLRHTRAALV